jgi:hypothetical protein
LFRQRLDAPWVVDASLADEGVHPIGRPTGVRARSEEGLEQFKRGRRFQPELCGFLIEASRHPVVDGCNHGVRDRSDDGEGFERGGLIGR